MGVLEAVIVQTATCGGMYICRMLVLSIGTRAAPALTDDRQSTILYEPGLGEERSKLSTSEHACTSCTLYISISMALMRHLR